MVMVSTLHISCNVSFYDNKVTIFYNGTRYDYIHTEEIKLKYPAEFGSIGGGIGILPEPDIDSPIVAHKSPMQSQVDEICVKEGDSVKIGEKLASVNSMKIIHDISSECNGKVIDVLVSVGESVDKGQTLIKVEREIVE